MAKKTTDFDKVKHGLTEGLAGLGGLVKKGVQRAKNVVYTAASEIERQAQDNKTPLGKITERAKEMDKKIKAGGGYAEAAKRAGDDIAKFAKEQATKIEKGYHSLQTTLQERFYTDGKFDEAKANKSLENMTHAINEFGSKAAHTLREKLQQGASAIKADYRDMVPTQEERNTKYEGIGADYAGILFREHYEKCIAFHEKARKNLPGGLNARKDILSDIKSSASGSLEELEEHYKAKSGKSTKIKLAAIEKYLSK